MQYHDTFRRIIFVSADADFDLAEQEAHRIGEDENVTVTFNGACPASLPTIEAEAENIEALNSFYRRLCVMLYA